MKTLEKTISRILLAGSITALSAATLLGWNLHTQKVPEYTTETLLVTSDRTETKTEGKTQFKFMGKTYNIDPLMLEKKYASAINPENAVTVIKHSDAFSVSSVEIEKKQNNCSYFAVSQRKENYMSIYKTNGNPKDLWGTIFLGVLTDEKADSTVDRVTLPAYSGCDSSLCDINAVAKENSNLRIAIAKPACKQPRKNSVSYSANIHTFAVLSEDKSYDLEFTLTKPAYAEKIMRDSQKLYDKILGTMRQELQSFEKMTYKNDYKRIIQQKQNTRG